MYLVSSGHCNAWSLIRGLRRIGVPRMDIAFLGRRKVELACGAATALGAAEWSCGKGDVVFFTEEASLRRHMVSSKDAIFHPKTLCPAFMDDKLAFARFAQETGDLPVVFSECDGAGAGDAAGLGYPVVLKPRSSWHGDRKLPRGRVVSSETEYVVAMHEMAAVGLDSGDLFVQQYLGGERVWVCSVSGWHSRDHGECVYVVTRKLIQDREPLGIGVIVEQTEDPDELVARTTRILDAGRYHGPFEMEFVLDEKVGKYRVLELNPRFWMQHSIFIDYHDNAVIKRYLGKDSLCAGLVENKGVVWVYTVGVVAALLKGRIRPLVLVVRMLLSGRPLSSAPGWGKAIMFMFQRWLSREREG